jgi:hypothetical protein
VLIAIRMFADFIRGTAVDVWCDNQAAVSILNSGKGKDPVLQAVARKGHTAPPHTRLLNFLLGLVLRLLRRSFSFYFSVHVVVLY